MDLSHFLAVETAGFNLKDPGGQELPGKEVETQRFLFILRELRIWNVWRCLAFTLRVIQYETYNYSLLHSLILSMHSQDFIFFPLDSPAIAWLLDLSHESS